MGIYDFRNVHVKYLNEKEAVIESIDHGIITIVELSGEKHKLSYPDAFFVFNNGFQKRRQFLSTNDKRLNRQLREETRGRICSRCGSLNNRLYTWDERKDLCIECLNELNNLYVKCSWCSRRVKRDSCGTDSLKQLICPLCYTQFLNSKDEDLTLPKSAPSVSVYIKTPVNCSRNHHRFRCIKAKVLFFNGVVCTPQIVDLLYCFHCNKYFIYITMLNSYEEKYGRMLVEHNFSDELKISSDWSLRFDYDLNPDSLLSRWGYIAQQSKQSDKERRAILKAIIHLVPGGKEEILRLLNGFIFHRSERCMYAAPLWKKDLDFVLGIDNDEPLFDFTF